MFRFLKSRSRSIAMWMILVSLAMAACTTPPKPKSNPANAESAALGIHVKIRAPIRILSEEPDVVVFARVEDGIDLTETYEVYGSTFARDGRAYLMNVEPGTYVAVAAFYEKISRHKADPADIQSATIESTESWRNYFSRELIEQTRITVGEGEFAVMGYLVTNQSMFFGDGDECQNHFMKLIEEDRSGFSKFLSGERSTRLDTHERDSSPAAKREFLNKTREYFEETNWVALIDSELSRLR